MKIKFLKSLVAKYDNDLESREMAQRLHQILGVIPSSDDAELTKEEILRIVEFIDLFHQGSYPAIGWGVWEAQHCKLVNELRDKVMEMILGTDASLENKKYMCRRLVLDRQEQQIYQGPKLLSLFGMGNNAFGFMEGLALLFDDINNKQFCFDAWHQFAATQNLERVREVVKGIQYLHGYALTQENLITLLRFPEQAFNLANGIVSLKEGKIDSHENIMDLTQSQFPHVLADGYRNLSKSDLWTPSYRLLLSNHAEHADSIAACLVILSKRNALTQSNQEKIIALGKDALSLYFDLKSFNNHPELITDKNINTWFLSNKETSMNFFAWLNWLPHELRTQDNFDNIFQYQSLLDINKLGNKLYREGGVVGLIHHLTQEKLDGMISICEKYHSDKQQCTKNLVDFMRDLINKTRAVEPEEKKLKAQHRDSFFGKDPASWSTADRIAYETKTQFTP